MSLDELFLMRRRKKIVLRQISEYIGCSVGLLSLYENDKCNLDVNKQIKYKEFIINY